MHASEYAFSYSDLVGSIRIAKQVTFQRVMRNCAARGGKALLDLLVHIELIRDLIQRRLVGQPIDDLARSVLGGRDGVLAPCHAKDRVPVAEMRPCGALSKGSRLSESRATAVNRPSGAAKSRNALGSFPAGSCYASLHNPGSPWHTPSRA